VSGYVTVSIGVTQAMPDETADEFVNRADRATYAAKNAGRNQTHALDTSTTAGALAPAEE
jgi:PleD family two-component response regulator